MVKKQAAKKVTTSKKSTKKVGKYEQVNAYGETVLLVKSKSGETRPKRKDSRQVKIERLEAEVKILESKVSLLEKLNETAKSQNDKLRAENNELKENIFKEINELGDKVLDSIMRGCPHKAQAERLKRWVWILAGALFGYAVLNIALKFYGY